MDKPNSEEMAARVKAWRDAEANWLIASQKPLRNRKKYRVGEIADALARKPARLEIDHQERRRIVIDILERIERREFADSDVLMLVGEPQLFLSFLPELRAVQQEVEKNIWADPGFCAGRPAIELHVGQVRINVDTLILRRAALRRYLEDCGLDGAPRLLREWFPKPATATEIIVSPAAMRAGTDRAGGRTKLSSSDRPSELPDDPVSQPVERPEGVSQTDWQVYLDAKDLKADFWKKRNGISEAARLVAKARGKTHFCTKFQSERRALTRVLKMLRQKKCALPD